jgi:hypothetical protein
MSSAVRAAIGSVHTALIYFRLTRRRKLKKSYAPDCACYFVSLVS